MLKVFIAPTDIADISEEMMLSEYRKNKITALKSVEAKKQSRAAGMLLAYALNACFGIDESGLEYGVTAQGKPYLVHYADIHFNISHTSGWCAVALSDKPVGIDIERIKNFFDGHSRVAVAKRYFTAQEIVAYGLNLSGAGKLGTRCFYRLWTAKESAVKCSGEGIAEGFKTFSLPFFTDRCEYKERYFTAFDTDEYAMSLCSRSDEVASIEIVSFFEDIKI